MQPRQFASVSGSKAELIWMPSRVQERIGHPAFRGGSLKSAGGGWFWDETLSFPSLEHLKLACSLCFDARRAGPSSSLLRLLDVALELHLIFMISPLVGTLRSYFV